MSTPDPSGRNAPAPNEPFPTAQRHDAPPPSTFGGRTFVCAARRTQAGLFQPVVMCQAVEGHGGVTQLPSDTEPYATAAEALRHAEQQAVRWMHDRSGDGQGRF